MALLAMFTPLFTRKDQNVGAGFCIPIGPQ